MTALTAGLVLSLTIAASAEAGIPKVGDTAADFTLQTPSGEPVRLATLNEKGPVVLVVLRGWPGYQCPICTRQVGELMSRSEQIAKAGARVVLVYPGPADGLKGHAEEFARGKALPDNFFFVIDTDYAFTKSYDLRWDAPKETAYPSTFVIDAKGKIVFAKTSKTHGDRARTADVIAALGRN